jgi:hypothetical protein
VNFVLRPNALSLGYRDVPYFNSKSHTLARKQAFLENRPLYTTTGGIMVQAGSLFSSSKCVTCEVVLLRAS